MKSPALDAARASTIAKLQAGHDGLIVKLRCYREGHGHGNHSATVIGATENPYVWRVRFADGHEELHHVDGILLP
jgi:hypothetical protein